MNTLYENFLLKDYNTFRINLKARYYLSISSYNFFTELPSSKSLFKDHRLFILGGGSNVLFTKDFDGLIVSLDFKNITKLHEDNFNVWLKVESGLWWDDCVAYCVANGYGGIENLSHIPGKVGSAPIQNIGAYGVEIKDVIDNVEVFDLYTEKILTFDLNQLGLSYRTSMLKSAGQRYIVLNITIKLSKAPVVNINYESIAKKLKNKGCEASIKEVRKAIKEIRSSLLPDFSKIGNAGSFFKNPIVDKDTAQLLQSSYPDLKIYDLDNGTYKLSAAWLIEKCGWKGFKSGKVGVYQGHSLVLVNYGGATGQEILDLSLTIKNSVKDHFGITLEEEVIII
jgi:UDP-N-acetylmuramate dehydrogenase